MDYLQEARALNQHKQFKDFLFFVALTLSWKLLPLIVVVTSNAKLQIVMGLAVIAVLMKMVVSAKLTSYLETRCERFSINIWSLYGVYIFVYFGVSYMLFW